ICDRGALDEFLDDLKVSTPEEIKKYQKIISQKDMILADAKSQSNAIIAESKKEAQKMVDEHSIMQQAQAEAMRLQLSHDEFDGLLADEHENTTEQNAEANPVAPVFEAPASRNAPCPCGSGLKYKQCHGRI
ncbi:MAG: SEC-C metal-binding domain-containing protein, partial [Acinetobacter pseudolwoffii]|nr:SEC-C metal-binding domain-containing protein [Acinetobacter pseudolwoffii]